MRTRLSSAFLCRHLASHGYAVAALDHSDAVARRVPEVRLALADHLHFVVDVEAAHESLRLGALPGEAAWIPALGIDTPAAG